jgi:class 3 adenylate cyclase
MVTKEQGEVKREPVVRKVLALLFADIVGSTAHQAAAGDLVFADALGECRERTALLLATHRGRLVKWIGDGFFAVFEDAASALTFATALQQSMSRDPIVVAGHRLAIRIGLHVGKVLLCQTSYGEEILGADVNLAARVSAMANPDEVINSRAAREDLPESQRSLLGPPDGHLLIKGVGDPIEVTRLHPAGR